MKFTETDFDYCDAPLFKNRALAVKKANEKIQPLINENRFMRIALAMGIKHLLDMPGCETCGEIVKLMDAALGGEGKGE